MTSLTIIGLGGRGPDDDWDACAGALIAARMGPAATAALPADISPHVVFDELLERDDLGAAVDSLVAHLLRLATTDDVVYLVPGTALLGDVTVARLVAELDDIVLDPGDHLLTAGGDAQLQIVDALALALAEEQEPFAAGLATPDPAVALAVTNWLGARVTMLAKRRLTRLGYQLPEPDEDGNLYIAPLSALADRQSFGNLRQIYARLRRPDGCPWDREQSELSTVPHLAEEADELREALEHADWEHAAEELGDVLGNVLMIAQIAQEQGRFTFEDVVASVSAKLVRRHPHVFGDATARDAEDVLEIWRGVKAQEQQDRDSAAGAAAADEGQGKP